MGSITRGIANNILGSGAVDATDGLSGTIPANNIANASLDNLTAFPPSVSAGIPQVASDPPSPTDGDVWYNTTSYKLKVRGYSVPAGTWASGGTLNAPKSFGSGAGTQTATLIFGGYNPSGALAFTEKYDGSSWTEVNDMNTGRIGINGSGTQTAAFSVGGTLGGNTGYLGNAEVWDGTNWTEVNDTNNPRGYAGACGTSTAGLFAGGDNVDGVGGYTGNTESWDGTNWTEVNDMNNGRSYLTGFGSQTAMIVAGGANPPGPSPTTFRTYAEVWDGTSWTEVSDLNETKQQLKGSGISTSGLVFGGSSGPLSGAVTANTEFWNGTSWTELSNLATAREGVYPAQQGSSSATLVAGGSDPSGFPSTTEEWTSPAGNLNVTLT